MDYKYKELELAQKIYENGFLSERHRATELRLLATYMRRILNYKPKRLLEEMESWCRKHVSGYRQETYYKLLKSATTQACKKDSTLVQINQIEIYQYEMDYIEALKISSEYAYDCRKLLFTLLFHMKINQIILEQKNTELTFTYQGLYFKGGKRKYTELKKLAKLSGKLKINEDIIHTLWTHQLVTPLHDGLIRLDFLHNLRRLQEQTSSIDKTVVLQIRDYDSVGWYYDRYHQNKRIAFCKYCGSIFRKHSNNEQYCSDKCKQLIKNQNNRKYKKTKLEKEES